MARHLALWLPELAGIVFSVLFLIGLLILLGFYDGKPVFSWHGVTLNAIVSILATASKASLMFAVAESMSQWKWILFSRERRLLMDFERIDLASRGPLGSLKLLWKSRRIGVLRLGILITLLVLAVDPFAQQLVQFSQQLSYTESNDIVIPRTERYSKGNEYAPIDAALTMDSDGWQSGATTTANIDFSMQSAILYGLAQPIASVRQQLSFNCPFGNCTWPNFESLAVCSKCVDLFSDLERYSVNASLYHNLTNSMINPRVPGTGYRLPNGLWMDNENGWRYSNTSSSISGLKSNGAVFMTSFGTGNTSKTVSMQAVDTLIWAQSIIRVQPAPINVTGWPDNPIQAVECALYYCVNSYESEIRNGSVVETLTAVSAPRNPDSWKSVGSAALPAPIVSSLAFNASFAPNRTDLQLVSQKAAYNVSRTAVDCISSYFQSLFSDTSIRAPSINGYMLESGELGGGTVFSPIVAKVLYDSADITGLFDAVALSMSNALRAGGDAGGAVVTGMGGTWDTFYSVQWAWIALLAAAIAVGAMFLGITIVKSAELASVWKSSALAVMSRGPVVGSALHGADTVAEMDDRAKKVEVLLCKDDELVIREKAPTVEIDELCQGWEN